MPTLPKPVDQTRLPSRLRTTTKTMHHRRVRQQALSTRHVRQALSTLVRQTTERTPHMTATDATTIACDMSPDCLHRACLDCGHPMRSGGHVAADHPGTRAHRRAGSCWACSHDLVRLIPADLKDQRHVLLSDDDMLRIMTEHPSMFLWHAQRRKRLKLGEYS